jgi:hypothetical protein
MHAAPQAPVLSFFLLMSTVCSGIFLSSLPCATPVLTTTLIVPDHADRLFKSERRVADIDKRLGA